MALIQDIAGYSWKDDASEGGAGGKEAGGELRNQVMKETGHAGGRSKVLMDKMWTKA